MTIGNRIYELRKAKGYTQEYVAEKLDVTRQAVSKWEQDVTSPDTKNLIALSSLLGASIEYIATGNHAEQPAIADGQIQKIASEEVGNHENKHKDKLHSALIKFILLTIISAFAIWAFGIVTGVFHDFCDINGLYIIFMPYGYSPTAIVLEAIYYLLLVTFAVLLYIEIKLEGKK